MISLEELEHKAGEAATPENQSYVSTLAAIAVAKELEKISRTLEEILIQIHPRSQ